MNKCRKVDKAALAAFCERNSIRRLSLFGSQLRGENGPDSDIDLLVEFDHGREPGLLGLVDIERELSTLLGGQTVDLRTPKDLSRYFRDVVIQSSQVQYAR